jgi:hypothetical protein
MHNIHANIYTYIIQQYVCHLYTVEKVLEKAEYNKELGYLKSYLCIVQSKFNCVKH